MKFFWLILYAFPLFAGETDQYLAADIVIKDSYSVINNYYNKKIEESIEPGEQLSCSGVTDKILTQIIVGIGHLTTKSLEIERFPDNSVSSLEYLKQSIYKNAGPLLGLPPLRRTINIGGVYLGTDKFGHFGLISQSYYRHYQKYLKNGLSKIEAEKKAILNGIKGELNLLGYNYNGVLSFADLEANYQGLLFANSICQGENSYLIKQKGQWVRNRKREFDIRNYMGPKMDESYNPSFRKPKLWKKIKTTLIEIYCPLRSNQLYLERMAEYNIKAKATVNDLYIQEYFSSKPEFKRELQSMENLCPKNKL